MVVYSKQGAQKLKNDYIKYLHRSSVPKLLLKCNILARHLYADKYMEKGGYQLAGEWMTLEQLLLKTYQESTRGVFALWQENL